MDFYRSLFARRINILGTVRGLYTLEVFKLKPCSVSLVGFDSRTGMNNIPWDSDGTGLGKPLK